MTYCLCDFLITLPYGQPDTVFRGSLPGTHSTFLVLDREGAVDPRCSTLGLTSCKAIIRHRSVLVLFRNQDC